MFVALYVCRAAVAVTQPAAQTAHSASAPSAGHEPSRRGGRQWGAAKRPRRAPFRGWWSGAGLLIYGDQCPVRRHAGSSADIRRRGRACIAFLGASWRRST
jgi:hypothetical protein